MECPKCKKEVADGLSVCPECGGKLETEAEVLAGESRVQAEETAEKPAESVPDTPKNEMKTKTASPAAKKKPAGRNNGKKNKKAYLAIRLTAIFCAVLMIALTVTASLTDVFETGAGSDRTMALSSLSSSDKKSFEEFIPAFSALFESGYKKSASCFADILPLMKPESASGLYAGSFEAQSAAGQPDPAGRFTAHSSVKASDVHRIASLLGLYAFDDANEKDYYYLDGSYYFAANENAEKGEAAPPQIKVVSSKKTQDGKYYVVCEVYPASAERDKRGNFNAAKAGDVYVIAKVEKADKQVNWTVDEISPKPIYDENGIKIETAPDGALSYEMRCKTFRAKTSKGVEFANYVVEYPFFTSDGKTADEVNTLYHEVLNTYKKKAETADALFAKYEKKGGKKDALPLYVHITASVTYNEKGKLSLIERTASYDGATSKTDPEALRLPETVFAGSTMNVKKGSTVNKSEIVGKDYYDIQRKLYTAYTGLDPETDDDAVGQAIYSGTWSLTKDGVAFWYQPNGYIETVVLPYSELEKNNEK